MSRRVILGVVAISAFLATPIWLNSTAGGASPGQSAGPPVVLSEAHHDVSPPLRSIPEAAPLPRSGDEVENEIPRVVRVPGGPDGALQHSLNAPVPGMPSPINNFAGAQNTDNASLVFPPDTEGDVGPNNYVQVVNLTFTIFNKAGVKLVGPSPTNTIWSGFGGLCQTHNDGDGVVLYDPLADRWLISQFAITSTASHQCIAISQTGDPTGAWFRYDFPYSTTLLNDYPKFGVWPDAYYMSANQFTLAGSTFSGSGVVAYERARMLQGLSARAVYIDLGANSSTSTFSGLLPADVDGTTPPPAGAPNHYLTIQGTTLGDPADRLQQWDFHVDWTTPANSSFTQAAVLPVAAFNGNMCNFARNCIGQLGTTAKLDAISDRLMFRNAYRNFGTYEAEVVDHTVNVGSNRGAIRWYEVRNTSTSPTLFQQGTYAGDTANTESRWMGSAALDANGDIAVGYSDSSASVHPSIRYVGRLVGDPLGTLPQGEATLITGAGAQTVANSRWGDYSMLAVDPTDDCTFWYTQEYYAAVGTNWQTRVGSFKFPSCGSGTTSPPVNMSAPVVSGSAVQGGTLSASTGTWSGQPPPTFVFQWQRCDSAGANCGNVGAASTTSTYPLTAADVGSRIAVVVTGSNSSGQASATSAPSAVVVAELGDRADDPGPGQLQPRQRRRRAELVAGSPGLRRPERLLERRRLRGGDHVHLGLLEPADLRARLRGLRDDRDLRRLGHDPDRRPGDKRGHDQPVGLLRRDLLDRCLVDPPHRRRPVDDARLGRHPDTRLRRQGRDPDHRLRRHRTPLLRRKLAASPQLRHQRRRHPLHQRRQPRDRIQNQHHRRLRRRQPLRRRHTAREHRRAVGVGHDDRRPGSHGRAGNMDRPAGSDVHLSVAALRRCRGELRADRGLNCSDLHARSRRRGVDDRRDGDRPQHLGPVVCDLAAGRAGDVRQLAAGEYVGAGGFGFGGAGWDVVGVDGDVVGAASADVRVPVAAV